MACLEGKVAIITGAGRGLGAGIARRMVADGATVAVAGLDGGAARSVAQELWPHAAAYTADVTSEADVQRLVADVAGIHDRLDVMVNNAGVIGARGSICDLDYAAFARTIAVHLFGVFLGTKYAAVAMRPQEAGSIVNTASTAGGQGGLGPHVFTAAKHAVVGLTKSAAVELARDGIRINAVAPGGHVTPMTAKLLSGSSSGTAEARAFITRRVHQRRAATPADIAGTYVFLASDDAWYPTGTCLVVDGANEVLAASARDLQPG